MHTVCLFPTLSKSRTNEIGMIIRSSGLSVSITRNLSEFGSKLEQCTSEPTLVLIESSETEAIKAASANTNVTMALLLLESRFQSLPVEIRRLPRVDFFLADSNPVLDQDLVTLASKVRSGEIFGLEKYLRNGTSISSSHIFQAEEKQNALNNLRRSIEGLAEHYTPSKFHEYARRIVTIADELMLNGLFYSNPEFDYNAHSAFHLPVSKGLKISWGFDGAMFGISVCDPFGYLGREQVIDLLTMSQSDEQRQFFGAGVKYVFERLTHLIINHNPGVQTEVIALLPFDRRLILTERRPSSLSLFTVGNKR